MIAALELYGSVAGNTGAEGGSVGATRVRPRDTVHFQRIGWRGRQAIAVLASAVEASTADALASSLVAQRMHDELRAAIARVPPWQPDPLSGEPSAHHALRLVIERCNLALIQHARQHTHCLEMGSHLLAALYYDNRLSLAQVGPGRLYRFHPARGLEQLTRDHAPTRISGLAGLPRERIHALGLDPQLEPEIHDWPVAPGERYLLSSPCLHKRLGNTAIAAVLQQEKNAPRRAVRQLLASAQADADRGGQFSLPGAAILIIVRKPFGA